MRIAIIRKRSELFVYCMVKKEDPVTYYWAKTTPEGNLGISVYDHMVNVGYVALCMAEMFPNLLERFSLPASTVGALSALHDIGKISPGFQRKCGAWLEENNLTRIARNGCWDSKMESDHSKVSHSVIQTFLSEKNIDRKTAKFVSAVIGAHHGRLNPPNDRGYRPHKLISETASNIDWDAERMAHAQMLWERFGNNTIFSPLSDESPSLWWLAGLTTVADWIGSDERFFSPVRNKADEDCFSLALHALGAISFQQNNFIRDLSFHDLFHDSEKPEIRWIPNDMQETTVAMINGPGVYVIEAPMGMGKTEAALWASYNLLVSGKTTGIYFALPTQATSNRIHRRMDQFMQRISPESQGSRLIHGNSWLMEINCGIHPSATRKNEDRDDDARAGRDWFSSTKRALLAPFGVGTVDQALLGVVAAKHFFVRHFALAGKVVVLDEVHSYDMYTGTLIDKLITTLEDLGCTVIVLSATLSGKRLRQIVSLPESEDESVLSYPLITGRMEGKDLKPAEASPPESKIVKVEFMATESAAAEAMNLARNGGAVLWICNTVDAAQNQYQQFMVTVQQEFPLGLLHSRFPFWRREDLETEWMERFGKNGVNRCGSILVSTQVVEQSVDLDADLMITEIAPTDMLLQRLGRLWRHEREKRAIDKAQLIIIEEEACLGVLRNLEPKAIKKALGSKAFVYAPFVLLRSLEVWKEQPAISLPSQIRQLIESTYSKRENEPDAWQQLSDEWFGTDSAKKMLASRNCNLWQVALEDEEGVQTRLNEMPTISLVLCRRQANQEIVFVDQSRVRFNSGQWRFAAAQAIHKNLVKVPKYCFDRIAPCPVFSDYLYGDHIIGFVNENGIVDVKGLQKSIRLTFSDELGVVIEKTSGKEEI